MQETVQNYEAMGILGGQIHLKLFPEVLKEVQEHIARQYADVLKANPDDNRELIKSYIEKYLSSHKIGIKDMEDAELSELIYGEMTGFSFLSKYLYRDDVEEINSATRS